MTIVSNQIAFCEILDTLRKLAESNAPTMAFVISDDDQSGQWTTHWTETRDAMEDHLGRPLTPAELTCLSMTRCHGPLPLLDDSMSPSQVTEMFKLCWPECFQPHFTGVHVALEWLELESRLSAVFNSETCTFL